MFRNEGKFYAKTKASSFMQKILCKKKLGWRNGSALVFETRGCGFEPRLECFFCPQSAWIGHWGILAKSEPKWRPAAHMGGGDGNGARDGSKAVAFLFCAARVRSSTLREVRSTGRPRPGGPGTELPLLVVGHCGCE